VGWLTKELFSYWQGHKILLFSEVLRLAMRSTQPPFYWGKRAGQEAEHHIHLVLVLYYHFACANIALLQVAILELHV
jgi:hypothetical protein